MTFPGLSKSMREKKWSRRLKTCEQVTLARDDSGAEFQTEQIQNDRDEDSHTVITLILRGAGPSETNTSVTHYNDFRIHHTHTHTHSETPCTQRTGEAGNSGMRKVPAQVSMGTKITHADYCMCAYVFFMSLCTSMCSIIFPYTLLLSLRTASNNTDRAGWVLLSRSHQADGSYAQC